MSRQSQVADAEIADIRLDNMFLGLRQTFVEACLQRFGTPVMMWVALIMMLNMGIALTAEMTAVGDIFTQARWRHMTCQSTSGLHTANHTAFPDMRAMA